MKITLDKKLKMCKEHIEERKTLSHVCEIHNYIKYYNETRIITKLKTSPINYRKQFLNNNTNMAGVH